MLERSFIESYSGGLSGKRTKRQHRAPISYDVFSLGLEEKSNNYILLPKYLNNNQVSLKTLLLHIIIGTRTHLMDPFLIIYLQILHTHIRDFYKPNI